MRKEIKITRGNGSTADLAMWVIAGEGVRLSADNVIKVFGDDEGFRSHIQKITEDSEPLYVENAEVITLPNLIDAVYSSTKPDLLSLFSVIQEVEDRLVQCA